MSKVCLLVTPLQCLGTTVDPTETLYLVLRYRVHVAAPLSSLAASPSGTLSTALPGRTWADTGHKGPYARCHRMAQLAVLWCLHGADQVHARRVDTHACALEDRVPCASAVAGSLCARRRRDSVWHAASNFTHYKARLQITCRDGQRP